MHFLKTQCFTLYLIGSDFFHSVITERAFGLKGTNLFALISYLLVIMTNVPPGLFSELPGMSFVWCQIFTSYITFRKERFGFLSLSFHFSALRNTPVKYAVTTCEF